MSDGTTKVELWTDIGERVGKGNKTMYAYEKPDGTHAYTDKRFSGSYFGAEWDVNVLGDGRFYTGGKLAPKYRGKSTKDLTHLFQVAMENKAVLDLEKAKARDKRNSMDIGELTLRQIRDRMDASFGTTRTALVATVVDYLLRTK